MSFRRQIAITCVLLSGFSAGFLGCGGGGGGEPSLRQVSLEELDPRGQTVTFWYQHDNEREAALLKLLEVFNRTNPQEIKVIGEHAGSHDDIYEKMLVRIEGRVPPGLVVAYRYQAQHYYQAGGVVDLAPYIDSPKYGLSPADRADYFQEILDHDRIQGVQVAFRPSRSMEVLYYNVDWLRELGHDGPPRTWSEFAEICRKAGTQPFSKAIGEGRSVGLVLTVDASHLAAMVFSKGGDLIEADGSAYSLNTPEMTESLSLLAELIGAGAAELTGQKSEVRQAFSSGRALFTVRSSSGMPLYRSDVAAGAGFVWDVAPVPYVGEHPVLNVYGASLAVGKTTPERQLAAWLFIKWFTQPEQQEKWAQKSNYFPVRKSTARSIASYFRISYDLLEHGQPEPWTVGYGAVRQMIEEAMVEVLQNGGSPEQILSALETEANRTLRE